MKKMLVLALLLALPAVAVDQATPVNMQAVRVNGASIVPSPVNGGIPYGLGSWWSVLAPSTDGKVLTLSGGVPSWQDAAGGGGTPGGSDTQLQYNNSGAFGGALGTSVTAGTGAIALTAQAATTTPLTIAGAAAQTAPHLRIEPVDAAVNAGVLRQSKQAQGAASKAGLGLTIYGDDAVAGSSSAGAAAGGSVTITAGNAARLTSGNAIGGDIYLDPGTGIGTSRAGLIRGAGSTGGIRFSTDSTVVLGWYDAAAGGTWGGYLRAGSTGGVIIASNLSIGWAASTTATTTADLRVQRKGAANPMWGAPAASPVAYTHTLAADSRSGTDTDIRGAKATLTPGIGTGTGGSGSFAVQTAVQGSTGTTANSTVDRQYVYSLAKALTDGSATGLFEVALPSGSHVGLTIEATVAAENASNYQTRRVAVQLAAHNKGGTVTASTPTEYGASELLDSGALTTTWTVTAGTGKITVNLNADSDLSTQTRLDVRYQLRIEGDTGTLVTEL